MIRFSLWVFALALALTLNPASAANVGFQQLRDRSGTEIGVWYPTAASPSPQRLELHTQEVARDAPPITATRPLIVISHGNGGGYAGHYDTALALAKAGFVVAALTHPGDNWRDKSRQTDVAARPRQLSALIDYMLFDSPLRAAIDARRVGAFGFSAGGLTVLIAAGGRPVLGRVLPHCAANPTFFDCGLIAGRSLPVPAQEWVADRRIGAIVVAAPALGFAFDRAGLAGVKVPVLLWRAAEDRVLPHPFYAEAVAKALPRGREYRVVPGAGHFAFLAPCSDALAKVVPPLCADAPGFDRNAFHVAFNAELVRFFRRRLK